MTDFKIGDKVRVIDNDSHLCGKVGLIVDVATVYDWRVKLEGNSEWLAFYSSQLKLVKEPKMKSEWSEIRAWNCESNFPEGVDPDDEVIVYTAAKGIHPISYAKTWYWWVKDTIVAYQVKKKPVEIYIDNIYVSHKGKVWAAVITVQLKDGKPDWSTLKVIE